MKSLKNFTTVSVQMIESIQLTALLSTMILAFSVQWSWTNVLIGIIFYFLYTSVGISMVFDRYWSHKSFEFKSPVLKWMFTILACLSGRGSPLAWVHIHRTHHMHSDKEGDPHKPGPKLSLFSFTSTGIDEFKPFIVRDLLSRPNILIHEYYLLLIVAWPSLLYLVGGLNAVYFMFCLPVVMVQFGQDLWNYYSHVEVGYTNFATRDNSRNVPLLWPIILGEAWHNNHHQRPRAHTTTVKKFEIDPIASVIRLVGVTGKTNK